MPFWSCGSSQNKERVPGSPPEAFIRSDEEALLTVYGAFEAQTRAGAVLHIVRRADRFHFARVLEGKREVMNVELTKSIRSSRTNDKTFQIDSSTIILADHVPEGLKQALEIQLSKYSSFGDQGPTLAVAGAPASAETKSASATPPKPKAPKADPNAVLTIERVKCGRVVGGKASKLQAGPLFIIKPRSGPHILRVVVAEGKPFEMPLTKSTHVQRTGLQYVVWWDHRKMVIKTEESYIFKLSKGATMSEVQELEEHLEKLVVLEKFEDAGPPPAPSKGKKGKEKEEKKSFMQEVGQGKAVGATAAFFGKSNFRSKKKAEKSES